ncbi:hypothetical protein [Arsukibacterium sp.]|uniref:hypothetical protein n=1 Tax=Arsukibacterium sp. TaxID=1977258 RepID=UPI002FDB575A
MQHNIAIPQSTSSYIKLLQLLLAVVLLWFVLHSWVLAKQQGHYLLQQHSQQLMRETLYALSHTAAYLINSDQLEGLEQLTQHIAANPYLHDVVIYDSNGVRMSWSQNSSSARLLYHPEQTEPLLAMVEEIRLEQQLLGYIKISVKTDASLLPGYADWQLLMQQFLGLLLMAGITVFLLKRGFTRWSRQSVRWQGPGRSH